jgi:hypothetical protein
MRIAPDKDTAKKEEEEVARRGGMRVYTDGSGFVGGIGAAAVTWGQGGEAAVRTNIFLSR